MTTKALVDNGRSVTSVDDIIFKGFEHTSLNEQAQRRHPSSTIIRENTPVIQKPSYGITKPPPGAQHDRGVGGRGKEAGIATGVWEKSIVLVVGYQEERRKHTSVVWDGSDVSLSQAIESANTARTHNGSFRLNEPDCSSGIPLAPHPFLHVPKGGGSGKRQNFWKAWER
ncbi:hypothetical protein BDQ17DRAFT_1337421 [Cyathus striatus]|nr:hypothetical protein BDQ17DRAFT_1337421 [Cyathus striatus]